MMFWILLERYVLQWYNAKERVDRHSYTNEKASGVIAPGLFLYVVDLA